MIFVELTICLKKKIELPKANLLSLLLQEKSNIISFHSTSMVIVLYRSTVKMHRMHYHVLIAYMHLILDTELWETCPLSIMLL